MRAGVETRPYRKTTKYNFVGEGLRALPQGRSPPYLMRRGHINCTQCNFTMRSIISLRQQFNSLTANFTARSASDNQPLYSLHALLFCQFKTALQCIGAVIVSAVREIPKLLKQQGLILLKTDIAVFDKGLKALDS